MKKDFDYIAARIGIVIFLLIFLITFAMVVFTNAQVQVTASVQPNECNIAIQHAKEVCK